MPAQTDKPAGSAPEAKKKPRSRAGANKARKASSYALKIERVRVSEDRVVCYVSLPNKRWRYTTPALAWLVIDDFPNITRHACVNAKGNTFGAVIKRTPLPHLLEHLTIDILAGRSQNPDDVFTGFSTWVGSEHDKARVEISMRDDVDTLKAVKKAARYINTAAMKVDAEHLGERKKGEAPRGARYSRDAKGGRSAKGGQPARGARRQNGRPSQGRGHRRGASR